MAAPWWAFGVVASSNDIAAVGTAASPTPTSTRIPTSAAKELAAKEPAKGEGEEGGGLKEGNVQVGQYQKYEAGPDGVAALQERARQMNLEKGEEVTSGKEQKRLHSQVPTY